MAIQSKTLECLDIDALDHGEIVAIRLNTGKYLAARIHQIPRLDGTTRQVLQVGECYPSKGIIIWDVATRFRLKTEEHNPIVLRGKLIIGEGFRLAPLDADDSQRYDHIVESFEPFLTTVPAS